MGASGREECFEKLAPEVKAFLEAIDKKPIPPLGKSTYMGIRTFFNTMGKMVQGGAPFAGQIGDMFIPGPEGQIPVRTYTPDGKGPFPILLFFHGGAWVVGDLLDAEDHICAALAEQTPCVVVSVNYRLAPEHPYPEGLEDCYAALQWATGHVPDGDGTRIAVSGESAGANLATVVTLMSKERGGPLISSQILFCPVTNLVGYNTESQQTFAEGFFLRRADMDGARLLYVPDERVWKDPHVSPLLADDLTGLPPALVITAGCDPLRDEGEAYARRLQDAGVAARSIRYEDMIHAFLLFFKSSQSTRKALELASAALREAFGRETGVSR
jgi:acetyl esterase